MTDGTEETLRRMDAHELLVQVASALGPMTGMLEDIHAACCEEPDENDGPSPLMQLLRDKFDEMRDSIDRQTRALDRLTAVISRQDISPTS